MFWLFFSLFGISAAPAATSVFDALMAQKYFEKVGFQCTTYTKEDGMACRGSLEKAVYPEPLAIFISPNYQPQPRVELIVHLHGWLEESETFDALLMRFKFNKLLADTTRNAVLVVPSSVGHCDTFKEHLALPQQFHGLLDAVTKLLAGSGLASQPAPRFITLTGHSGSYSTLENILTGQDSYVQAVKEVFLLDTIYDEGEGFVKFAQASPPFRFVSAFLPLQKENGDWKWTAEGNFALWTKLNPNEAPLKFLPSLLDADAGLKTIGDAAAKGPVFMKSDVSHNDTVIKYFPRLLRAVHH